VVFLLPSASLELQKGFVIPFCAEMLITLTAMAGMHVSLKTAAQIKGYKTQGAAHQCFA